MRPTMLILMAVQAAACATARRTAAPPAPAATAPAPPGPLSGVDLYLGGFKMDGLRSVDGPSDVDRLAYRLGEYLQSQAPFRSIQLGRPPPAGDTPALRLDVWIDADHDSGHTLILDYFAFFPPVFGLFAPWWGDTKILVAALFTDASGKSVAFYRADASREFMAAFWAWYRTDFVEDAFAASYQAAFGEVAGRVAVDAAKIAALAAPARVETPVGPNPPPEASSPNETPSPASGLLLPTPPPEPPRFGILGERPRPGFDGTVYGALGLLGGVEGGPLYGFARVSSSVKDEIGEPVEVAAGRARQKGYRIALYSAPTENGWFWYPVVGFLSQNIDVTDFRQSIEGASPDGSTDIEAVCSDPDTGATIACDSPNTYGLAMRSGYGGARAGYSVVAGSPNIELFLSLNAGLNALEYRAIRADVGAYSAKGTAWAWLNSGALGMTYGLRLPKLHAALRLILDYEWYREFAYAEPVLFKGPVRYNPDKQTYEQVPLFVEAARLGVWSFQIAAGVVF